MSVAELKKFKKIDIYFIYTTLVELKRRLKFSESLRPVRLKVGKLVKKVYPYIKTWMFATVFFSHR